MKKMSLIVLFLFISFGIANAQIFLETDSLPKKFVLILPTADNNKLQSIKTEFVKYSQIESAIYVFQNHHALLIELNSSSNSNIIYYKDIMKIVTHGVEYEEIFIKDPIAYAQILSEKDNDSAIFIVK